MNEYLSTLIMPCLGEQCGSSGGGKQSDGDGKPRSGHKEEINRNCEKPNTTLQFPNGAFIC